MKRIAIYLVFILALSTTVTAQNSKSATDNIFKKVVLFWDTSLSVQDRNLSLELVFLDNFIKDKADLTILLVKFSNTVISEKTYIVNNANWNGLKQELLQTTYDGATSFNPLVDSKYTAYDAYLLFTDGYQNQTTLRKDITKPLIVVSGNAKTYFQSLQLKTLSNLSHFIDLNTITLADALKSIGIVSKAEIVYQQPLKQTHFKIVSGIVTSIDEPLEGVNVRVEGTNIGAVTNSKGFYRISAKEGYKLVFSYLGFRSHKTIILESNLDIRLLTDETRLNVVEIQGKNEQNIKQDDINLTSDKNKKIGYAVQSITSDDINPIETNISQSVQGKFSGVSLGQDQDLSRMIIRGYNSITQNEYPLIVLDGVPLRRADSSGGFGGKSDISFIDPDNVAKISILKGLAATNRYGSEGRNGVIVIFTKTYMYNENNKPVDRALLKNNIYKENLSLKSISKSTYIIDLKTSKSVGEAYKKYLKLRIKYRQSYIFYFEVSDYFKQWGNTVLADRILSNVLEINFNNPVNLKALAFKFEANKDLDKAAFVYKRILRLQPKSAQSYKNMAIIYTEQRHLTKAFYLYKSMLEGTIRNVDFSGLRNSLVSEFKSLIQQNKSTLPTADLAEEYFKTDNINARLYFEWIDPDMAFEIQFVNPQKRFFSWTHSLDSDAQRIDDEKTQGFAAEEFLLIDAEKGSWLVNLTNLNANETKDQILKICIFKNYGKPNQTKEVKVVNLTNYNKKAALIKIEI